MSYYERVRHTTTRHHTTIADLVDSIASDEYADQVEAIRELVRTGDIEEAKKLKAATLPAVSISGSVTEGKRARACEEGRFKHSGLLQVDIDAGDNPELDIEAVLGRIARDPHTVSVFLSPSGNGVKAVVRIPADAGRHRAAFETVREYFQEHFDVKIDKACKDPVRLCFVSHDPDALPVKTDAVEFEVGDAAEEDPPRRRDSPASKKPASGKSKGDGLVLSERGGNALTLDDLRDMLGHIEPERGTGDGYDNWLKVVSGAFAEFGRDAIPVLEEWAPCKEGELEYKFAHRQQDCGIGSVIWMAQRNGYRPPVRVRAASLGIPEEQAERLAESVDSGSLLRALDEEHRGLAELYATARFGSRAYVHDEGRWRKYEAGVWKPDETGETVDDLQSVGTALLVEAANLKLKKLDPEKDKSAIQALKKRSRCLLNLRTARTVLENAGSIREFRSIRSKYDQSPDLLAIENGTVDFDRCEVRDHSPGDMLTVRAPLVYDPEATCPAFDEFLAGVTCGDQQLADFLLERTAYALTGHTWSDEMVFHYGDGANGKSTFIHTVEMIFGNDIFRTLDNRLLVGSREQSSDEYLRASLQAARLAVMDELPDGKKLRTDELKKLVGGDSITARQPYERQRTFRPTHKLWMCGNHKPDVGTTDHGTWRRILLVPWAAKFSGEGPTREQRVSQHFAERAGILNRLLAAWEGVQKRGSLIVPDAVRGATQEYKSASDQVGQFAHERLREWEGGSVALSEVLKAFQFWCDDNGESPSVKSGQKLSAEMRRLGFHTRQGAQRKTLVDGIAIAE